LEPLTCAALALSAGIGCADVAVLDGTALFPEGPYVTEAGPHWVEYADSMLMRWDGSAAVEVWRGEGCGPSAVMPFGAGFLLTCYDSGKLVEVGADGAQLAEWSADDLGEPLVGPNDLTSDGAGGAFFTASGPWEAAPIAGKVYWLAPGAPAPQMLADDLHYANGIALNPQDGRLYVAESEAGRIISFAITEGPGLTDRRLALRLVTLDPESGPLPYPDGFEFGPDGNLWIGQYSQPRILVAAPDGTLVGRLELPGVATPNLAFSADGKTLYVAVVDSFEAPYPGKLLAVTLTAP
jgi:gluconolactonase